MQEFPLAETASHSLAAELPNGDLVLGPYPAQAPDRDQLLFILERAGCRSLLVRKERGGRWWQGPNGRVLVEWAAILKPQRTFSIGLESENTAGEGTAVTDAQAKADLRAALEALYLDQEPLVSMNYMDALANWIDGGQIPF